MDDKESGINQHDETVTTQDLQKGYSRNNSGYLYISRVLKQQESLYSIYLNTV